MNHLKISFVVLMAFFALALSSVVLESANVDAPVAVAETVAVPVASEDAVTAEEAEKQGGQGGGGNRPPPPPPPPRRGCPQDRENCYQTQYCDSRCRVGSNTGRGDACDNGGFGNYCGNWCRCTKGNRWTGEGDRCWCHCTRRGGGGGDK